MANRDPRREYGPDPERGIYHNNYAAALEQSMINTPKGETIPQTVENLQEIMAKDAIEMEGLQQEINSLRKALIKREASNKKLYARNQALRESNKTLEDHLTYHKNRIHYR